MKKFSGSFSINAAKILHRRTCWGIVAIWRPSLVCITTHNTSNKFCHYQSMSSIWDTWTHRKAGMKKRSPISVIILQMRRNSSFSRIVIACPTSDPGSGDGNACFNARTRSCARSIKNLAETTWMIHLIFTTLGGTRNFFHKFIWIPAFSIFTRSFLTTFETDSKSFSQSYSLLTAEIAFVY